MNIASLYQSKLTTPAQAVAGIASGSRISMAMAQAEPPALLSADAKVPRMVPRLERSVTVPRTDIYDVATEFSPVNLKGPSSAEQARALISLAHPDFRDELTEAAKAQHLM